MPALTRGHHWGAVRPDTCFNIGVTYEGLRALGLAARHLPSFAKEFRLGMSARAVKLGDFGSSAPDHWPAPFDAPARVHLVASLYAGDAADLDRVQGEVAQAFGILGVRDGAAIAGGKVFCG